MTKKIVRWWHKIKYWDKIRMFIGAFGIGGEIGLHMMEFDAQTKVLGMICTAIALFITLFIKDDNSNGIIDITE